MLQKSAGFILHSLPYGETSVILRVFTKEQQRISIMAKGVRKAKSRLAALLQPFMELEWIWYEKPGRDLHLLKEVNVIRQFSGISDDYDRYLSASGCLEQYDRFYPEGDSSDGLYGLLPGTLELITSAEKSAWNHFFALWLIHLELLGYSLLTDRCIRCGLDLSETLPPMVQVDLNEGGVLCEQCQSFGKRIRVKENVIHAINYLKKTSPQKRTERTISRETALMLFELLDEFTGYHMEWFHGMSIGKMMFGNG